MNAFPTKMLSALAFGQMALGAVLLLRLRLSCRVGPDYQTVSLDLVPLNKARERGWQDKSEKKLARAQSGQRFSEVVKTGSPGFIPQGR